MRMVWQHFLCVFFWCFSHTIAFVWFLCVVHYQHITHIQKQIHFYQTIMTIMISLNLLKSIQTKYFLEKKNSEIKTFFNINQWPIWSSQHIRLTHHTVSTLHSAKKKTYLNVHFMLFSERWTFTSSAERSEKHSVIKLWCFSFVCIGFIVYVVLYVWGALSQNGRGDTLFLYFFYTYYINKRSKMSKKSIKKV